MLTDTGLKALKPTPGKTSGTKHFDGGGLHLLVLPTGGKYWRLNLNVDGKRKTLALGTYPDVSLANARKRRAEHREKLANGIQPVTKAKAKQALATVNANTFDAIARDWLIKTAARRSPDTSAQILAWLNKDVFPFIGTMPISTIKASDILQTLRRVEARGAIDSAHRVKQIVGQVFRYAIASDLAEHDVTANLKGALSAKVKVHHPAITEPALLGGLLRAIERYQGQPTTKAALKLLPHVFTRPGELRQAEWSEIDFTTATWTIPACRMKMRKDHIVPLSSQVLAILQGLRLHTGHGKYVFPSIRSGTLPMSDSTLNSALCAMGFGLEVHVPHGFRATFRTIGDEVCEFRPDLMELQLAHKVPGPLGAAYSRAAHLPARREMMQRWSDYLDSIRDRAIIIT